MRKEYPVRTMLQYIQYIAERKTDNSPISYMKLLLEILYGHKGMIANSNKDWAAYYDRQKNDRPKKAGGNK